jgi:hypothetical protein
LGYNQRRFFFVWVGAGSSGFCLEKFCPKVRFEASGSRCWLQLRSCSVDSCRGEYASQRRNPESYPHLAPLGGSSGPKGPIGTERPISGPSGPAGSVAAHSQARFCAALKYNQRRFFIIRWGGPGFWIPFRQGLPQDGVFSYVAFLWTCSWIKRESPPESERAFLESGRAHFSLRVGWTGGFLQTGLGVSGRVLARSRIHHRFLANSSTPRLCWGAPLQGGALVESVSTAYASRTYPRSGRIRSCTVNPVLEISASVLGGVLFAIWAVNIVCRPEATGSFVGIESSYCRMHAQFENVYPEVLICPHGRENGLPRRL